MSMILPRTIGAKGDHQATVKLQLADFRVTVHEVSQHNPNALGPLFVACR